MSSSALSVEELRATIGLAGLRPLWTLGLREGHPESGPNTWPGLQRRRLVLSVRLSTPCVCCRATGLSEPKRLRFRRAVTGRRRDCRWLARPRRFAPARRRAAPGGEQVVGKSTTIIGGPVSPYVRKVMAVCDLKGAAYRIDPIIPFQGNDEFSRLSPLRRISVLIDDKVPWPIAR